MFQRCEGHAEAQRHGVRGCGDPYGDVRGHGPTRVSRYERGGKESSREESEVEEERVMERRVKVRRDVMK